MTPVLGGHSSPRGRRVIAYLDSAGKALWVDPEVATAAAYAVADVRRQKDKPGKEQV